jgi:hypothetical protein
VRKGVRRPAIWRQAVTNFTNRSQMSVAVLQRISRFAAGLLRFRGRAIFDKNRFPLFVIAL